MPSSATGAGRVQCAEGGALGRSTADAPAASALDGRASLRLYSRGDGRARARAVPQSRGGPPGERSPRSAWKGG